MSLWQSTRQATVILGVLDLLLPWRYRLPCQAHLGLVRRYQELRNTQCGLVLYKFFLLRFWGWDCGGGIVGGEDGN